MRPAPPRPLVVFPFLLIWSGTAPAIQPTETIRADLKLRTGGAISGPVVDFTEHGVVIVHERVPYVFAWSEIELGSAMPVLRALLALRRGGEKQLTARDHVLLGVLALRHGRGDLAASEFQNARKLDAGLAVEIEEVIARSRAELEAARDDDLASERALASAGGTPSPGADAAPDSGDAGRGLVSIARQPLPPQREKVLDAYHTFGRKVQEVLGKDIVLVESDHFLIWTDWEPRNRPRLSGWLEAMYAALCGEFDLDPAGNIFLAKCPVFCFRSKGRFVRFAKDFDGHDARDSIGYTRSIESNGHVHLVLLRQGRAEVDYDRLAWTLVHEGTHAFVHRLYTSRLIPHWVNEGLAELMAERVLGNRCPAGENADLLAGVYVTFDRTIMDVLAESGPIDVNAYPLVHSVVAHLEGRGRDHFAGFLRELKEGDTVAEALGRSYDGLTLEGLERDWRSAVRAAGVGTGVDAGAAGNGRGSVSP